jgi:hypothetical protein
MRRSRVSPRQSAASFSCSLIYSAVGNRQVSRLTTGQASLVGVPLCAPSPSGDGARGRNESCSSARAPSTEPASGGKARPALPHPATLLSVYYISSPGEVPCICHRYLHSTELSKRLIERRGLSARSWDPAPATSLQSLWSSPQSLTAQLHPTCDPDINRSRVRLGSNSEAMSSAQRTRDENDLQGAELLSDPGGVVGFPPRLF